MLALMLFQHSRRASRVNSAGDVITLEDQDRKLWDQTEIGEGVALLEKAARRERRGPYLVQAAIAQCHATATTAADTNWALIAGLYALLAELIPSDVVMLNWAVAIGMDKGPAAGIQRVDDLAAAGRLDGYYLLPATRADLLRRLGRANEAAESYRQALDLAVNEAERRYLAGRLAEVTAAAGGNGSTPG